MGCYGALHNTAVQLLHCTKGLRRPRIALTEFNQAVSMRRRLLIRCTKPEQQAGCWVPRRYHRYA